MPSESSPLVHPTIVLVPLTAYTLQKDRIGKGGGYYDSYMEKAREDGRLCMFIGIGLECCRITEDIEVDEAHDQKLDYIVTEKSIIC